MRPLLRPPRGRGAPLPVGTLPGAAAGPGHRPAFLQHLVPFRIKELEDKLQSVQLTRKKEEETFRRK